MNITFLVVPPRGWIIPLFGGEGGRREGREGGHVLQLTAFFTSKWWYEKVFVAAIERRERVSEAVVQ